VVDEPPARPQPAPRRVAAGARRLGSPVGLVLAGLCLLLPFLSGSCATGERPRLQWQVTYTGADVLTGGRPDIAFTEDADEKPMARLDEQGVRNLLGGPPAPLPPQPTAWLAVALMAAALAVRALPSRAWRETLTGGLALAATVVLAGATILARNDAADAVAAVIGGISAGPPAGRSWESYDEIRETFRYEYGFWLAIVALAAVGVVNTVAAVRRPAGSATSRE
jgi:hypothetical protein